MEYVVNGERISLLDFTEYVTPFKVTEEFVEKFNNTNTKYGVTKNIINKGYVGKWVFLVCFEMDGYKQFNNMGSLYLSKIRQEICSKPYDNRDEAFNSLDSFIKLIITEKEKRIIEI